MSILWSIYAMKELHEMDPEIQMIVNTHKQRMWVAVITVAVIAGGAGYWMGRSAGQGQVSSAINQLKNNATESPIKRTRRARKTRSTTPTGPVMMRANFRKAIMGKTPQQVLAKVGKPKSTQDQDGSLFWYYRNKSKDPITGQLDYQIQVVFRKNRVSSVNF